MRSCHVCRTDAVLELLDVGPQPIGNRFLSDPAAEETLYPMSIGQCQACGLLQTIHPVPADELVPPYDWINYMEPEDHLDHLVEAITRLPGVTRQTTIAGVSFKDDSTLARFERLGFRRSWRVDPRADLGIQAPGAGVESIQHRLSPSSARAIAQKRGPADIVIVRHILEHAHRFDQFMEAIRGLAKASAYLVFEVPDCTTAFDTCDYTTLWEEHILYFTPASFRNALTRSAGAPAYFKVYPYAFESSLVGVVHTQAPVEAAAPAEDILEKETRRAQTFACALPATRTKLQQFMTDYRRTKGRIAMFGAGHLACTYLSVLQLREHIEFVADDNPHKRGLYMPGSRIPILASGALLERDIKLCLLSLNPLNEEKVLQRNQAFLQNGGAFYSLFPASKYALKT